MTFADLTIAAGTGANASDSIIRVKATGEFLAIVKNQTTLKSTDFVSSGASPTPSPSPQVLTSVNSGNSATFTGTDTEASIIAKNAPSVKSGTTSFYVGYEQVSGTNQDPRLIRFDNGSTTWFAKNYEVTGDDSRGYGLLWDGANNLYGVFSAVGAQGTPDQDFRRFATKGWLTSYGQGGGPRVSIVAKIDPVTGNVINATYLTSKLSNGNANSLTVKSLAFNGQNVVVQADAFFSPLKTDRTPFTCNGTSPFNYSIELTPDLGTAVSATADQCT